MSLKARVFISCGQCDEGERKVAGDISRRLSELGFEPYVAVEEQTLKGLKENIFWQLDHSEYMIFVDFRREKLGDNPDRFRGSLFSNQELAIAAFKNLEVVVLRETGVELNGISKFIQENAMIVSNRQDIAATVANEIRRKEWKSDWRNELSLTHKGPTTEKATRVQRDLQGNVHMSDALFWHGYVTNHHYKKPASNCYIYLERIFDCESNETTIPETIELKWAGYVFPNALVGPVASRAFDAFYAERKTVAVAGSSVGVNFNSFSDSTQYRPKTLPRGKYTLTYRVIAENFPAADASFRVIVPEDPFLTSMAFPGPEL